MSRESLRTSLRRRERFFPHAFVRGGVELRLDAMTCDGGRLAARVEDDADARELHLEDDRFETLELRGRVVLEPSTLAGVLPPSEVTAPPVRLVIVVECEATRLRRAVMVDEGDLAIETPFDLRIPHDDFDGRLGVVPWLVRARPGGAPGYAREPGARLATGAGYGVHTHAPRPRAGEYLSVEYRSFAEDPVLRRSPERLHHLDLDGDPPRLLINADHEAVVSVLDAKGSSGAKARLREVFFDVVSQSVWQQLFFHAVAALDESGDVRRPWQRGVLATLLPHAFPSIRSHGARIDELLAIRREPSALALLAELGDRAIQPELELAKHMTRLVEETLEREDA